MHIVQAARVLQIRWYPPCRYSRRSCWHRNLGWFPHPCRYEHDEAGIPTAGFGGVLVSPSGKPTNFFSFGKNLEKLNPTGKKTAIFQCEFFAVLVALI